ncbi:MAG: biotin/lipoyl-containing protein, partial [Chromatiaceae bacterium]
GTRRDGALTRSGAAGASWLSPSARRKGDWDVPFRILSTATLRSIEAMKMETMLTAEREGVIHAIHARHGESINTKDLLVEFA